MKEDEHVTHSPSQEINLAILRNVAVSVLNLLTPPERRKESRPAEMLRHSFHPFKLLKQLQTLGHPYFKDVLILWWQSLHSKRWCPGM